MAHFASSLGNKSKGKRTGVAMRTVEVVMKKEKAEREEEGGREEEREEEGGGKRTRGGGDEVVWGSEKWFDVYEKSIHK